MYKRVRLADLPSNKIPASESYPKVAKMEKYLDTTLKVKMDSKCFLVEEDSLKPVDSSFEGAQWSI